MKIIGIALFGLVLISLNGACSKKPETPSSGDSAIQGLDLPASEPLTSQQKDQIAELRTPASPGFIAGLLLVPLRESAADRQARERSRTNAPEAVRTLVDRVEAGCVTSQPQETITGTITKVGDIQTTSSTATIEGAACPMVATQRMDRTMTLRRIQTLSQGGEVLLFTFNLRQRSEQTGRIVDPLVYADVGTIEESLILSTSGVLLKRPMGDYIDLQIEGGGERVLANGERARIRVRTDVDLNMSVAGTPVSGTWIQHTWIIYRSTEYVFSTAQEFKDSRILKQQSYLNGEKTALQSPIPLPENSWVTPRWTP